MTRILHHRCGWGQNDMMPPAIADLRSFIFRGYEHAPCSAGNQKLMYLTPSLWMYLNQTLQRTRPGGDVFLVDGLPYLSCLQVKYVVQIPDGMDCGDCSGGMNIRWKDLFFITLFRNGIPALLLALCLGDLPTNSRVNIDFHNKLHIMKIFSYRSVRCWELAKQKVGLPMSVKVEVKKRDLRSAVEAR